MEQISHDDRLILHVGAGAVAGAAQAPYEGENQAGYYASNVGKIE